MSSRVILAIPSRGAIERLRLQASGGEYFRVWIVNLLLSIVMLGVYTTWAKVGRN